MVVYGILFSLVIVLIALQIGSRKKRKSEAAGFALAKAEMERTAEKSALRYKHLLECAGDAIFVLTAADGRLEEMNSKGSELFGYSREEMGKIAGRDLVQARDHGVYAALVRRVARHGEGDEACLGFKRKDGGYFLGEVSARLVDLGDEKVVLAIVRDITLKKEAEWELTRKSEELLRSHQLLEKNSCQLELSRERLRKNLELVERANLELERLGRMKNHIIGMISHEFKTPLTSILSGTEFLLTHYAATAPEEMRQLLGMVRAGGGRLNDIVSDLLKVARLDGDGSAAVRSTLQLNDILLVVHEQFEPVLRDRGMRVVMEGVEGLPFFQGNREYILDIFCHLLGNAIKFTPDGGEICIAARVADRAALAAKETQLCLFNEHFYEQMGCKCYMQVEVRDSGIGIAAGEQLQIFDTFYEVGDLRHHSSGRYKFQGKRAGLGLAIVKGMVEAHGGMVWVESPATEMEERPGSSFFLLLPLEEVSRQAAFPFMH